MSIINHHSVLNAALDDSILAKKCEGLGVKFNAQGVIELATTYATCQGIIVRSYSAIDGSCARADVALRGSGVRVHVALADSVAVADGAASMLAPSEGGKFTISAAASSIRAIKSAAAGTLCECII